MKGKLALFMFAAVLVPALAIAEIDFNQGDVLSQFRKMMREDGQKGVVEIPQPRWKSVSAQAASYRSS